VASGAAAPMCRRHRSGRLIKASAGGEPCAGGDRPAVPVWVIH